MGQVEMEWKNSYNRREYIFSSYVEELKEKYLISIRNNDMQLLCSSDVLVEVLPKAFALLNKTG